MDAGTLTMPRRSLPLAPPSPEPVVSNTRLAIIIVITAEAMLFSGLIGMYLVFRVAAPTWPPPDLPRLPLALTAFNTLVLFASLVPMRRALRALRAEDGPAATRAVCTTAALGALFLAIQGGEWIRLLGHGLTLASGTYGATFYVMIGCHGVHVLAAVIWLVVAAMLTSRGTFTAARHAGLEMCAIYWYFVCGLWGVLFPLVYLY
jgi:cytochrome c oxidase subunit 3